jgi:hypothetical protein
MLDLSPADCRTAGIRADEEEEIIGLLDPLFDLLPPVYGGLDAFPVNPEIQLLALEGFSQPAGGVDVQASLPTSNTSNESIGRTVTNTYSAWSEI